MRIPELKVEKIREEAYIGGKDADIYVINGPLYGSITTSLCCTGCGKRELYRFEGDDAHVAFKCPHCGSTSIAFLKDFLGEETE